MVELVEVTGFTCRYCNQIVPRGELLSKHEMKCRKEHAPRYDMRKANHGHTRTKPGRMHVYSINLDVDAWNRAWKYIPALFENFSTLARTCGTR